MKLYFAWTGYYLGTPKLWGAFTTRLKALEAAGWTGTTRYLNEDRQTITIVEGGLDEVLPDRS